VSLPTAYLDQFSEPEGYFEFASIGPPSRRVVEALGEFNQRVANPRGHPRHVLGEVMQGASATVASFLSCRPEQVGLVGSTGIGLFHVAFGLRGGNVVVPAGEFPANLYPWWQARDAGLIDEVRLLEVHDGRVTPGRMSTLIDAGTVAVSVSQVDYLTGFQVDLEGLRAVCGEALLVVDAIQAAGAVPVSLEPADVVVAGSHKWLRGGFGIAFLALSERALERLCPTLSGWTAVESFLDFSLPNPRPWASGAARFQLSAPPLAGAPGLIAALELAALAGMERISAAVRERSAAVAEVLGAAGAQVLTPWRSEVERAGIVGFRMPGEDPAETHQRLVAEGLSVTLRGDRVRVAPHATSSMAAIERLGEVLPNGT
jgi:selenocysteine lyase/cysteine desulfurase